MWFAQEFPYLNNLLGSFTTANLWIVAVVSPLQRANIERFGGSVHSAFSHSLSLINSPLWWITRVSPKNADCRLKTLQTGELSGWKSSGVNLIGKREAVLRWALLFIREGSTACHNGEAGIDIKMAASRAGRSTKRTRSRRRILPGIATPVYCPQLPPPKLHFTSRRSH